MAMHSFDHLLKGLPDCDKFPLSNPLPPGIGYVKQPMPMFVPASLSDVESVDASTPTQVLIVSAPGAVGKSTLAKEVAFRKAAPLWDLALAPEVGSGSLNGTLFGALAKGHTDDFLEYLREGLQFIVVDALDEGRTKVNENSFGRLLEDMGHLARHSKGVCFVLLGRTHIAETAWLALAEEQVNVSMISIVPFGKDQANQYIDNKVDQTHATVL